MTKPTLMIGHLHRELDIPVNDIAEAIGQKQSSLSRRIAKGGKLTTPEGSKLLYFLEARHNKSVMHIGASLLIEEIIELLKFLEVNHRQRKKHLKASIQAVLNGIKAKEK